MLVGSADCGREELALLSYIAEVWGGCMPYEEVAHERLLVDLWRTAFGKSAFERHSPKWASGLGFQGCDPCTDLRGVGVVGLEHLLAFCRSGAGSVVITKVSHGASTFPLAAASLNVSMMLCAHMRLFEPTGRAAPPQCSLETLKHAVRLQLSVALDPAVAIDDGFERLTSGGLTSTRAPRVSLLTLMHAQLLRRLFDQWETATHADEVDVGAQVLRHFPSLLAESAWHMQRALASLPGPWEMRTLLVALRGVEERGGDGRCASRWINWVERQQSCPQALHRMAAAAIASVLLFGVPAGRV